MRGLIILVLCALFPVGYSKESYFLNTSQLTGKMNNEGGSGAEPEANRLQPYSFTSTVFFDSNIGQIDKDTLFCLGVLITLSHVLSDIICLVRINIRMPFGQPRLRGIPLTKVWVGIFYGFEYGYYRYISHAVYANDNGLSVVVLETAAEPSQFVSLAYIPRRIDHGDLCGLAAVKPVFNVQNCRLEPLGMRIDKTGQLKIEATPQREAYYVISLGGPLFYTNKLIAIYGSFHISNEEGSEYRYKNISSHMEFINRFAPIQEYDMFIHDPMFPMPE